MEPHRPKLENPDPGSAEVTARVLELIRAMTPEALIASLSEKETGIPDHGALRAASLRRPRRPGQKTQE